MNLAHLLLRSARLCPERPALIHGERVVADYRGFARRAAALATTLSAGLGLGPGERVALFMTNRTDYLQILFGAWWAGLAVVPINAKLHPREAAFIVEESGARCLFLSDGQAAGVQPLLGSLPDLKQVFIAGTADCERLFGAVPMAAPAERGADDLAWLFYTSGTTGKPKGAMLSQRNLMTMTSCYFMDVDGVAPGDAALYAAPMSHGAGLYVLPHVLAGAGHVVPESGGFDAAEILALARHHARLSMFAAPTTVKRLVAYTAHSGADPSGIKTVVYGGAPMYAEDVLRALAVMGPRFVQIYGQGESPMTITALSRAQLGDTAHPRYLQRIASVGVAQSAVEVRVADDQGRALPTGETGEILVRGDSVMLGYWRNAQATARTLRDGWLWTGDVGALDEDGFLTLKDRSKDVIISGGSNIYPREVEEVLLRHPAVDEVSVVGRPDAEWGEAVVACVVLRPGAGVTAAELDALCLEHIARFKRPKDYRFLDALPKNNYGKVLKTELRALLRG